MRPATSYRGAVEQRSGQRLLAGAGAPDDTGAADPALAAALAAYADDPAWEPEVLAALAEARLLVPVVAELGEAETGPDGLVRDKSSDMAAVLMRGADGRHGAAGLHRPRGDAPVGPRRPAGAGVGADGGPGGAPGRRRGAADRRGRAGALRWLRLARHAE